MNNTSYEAYNQPIYVHNMFFIISFMIFINIFQKLNKHFELISRLESLYTSLEYQTAYLNKHKITRENTTDIIKDSVKELKTDVRSLQKHHEQLLVKFRNLQQECKELQINIYNDIKLSEDRQQDDRDSIKQGLHLCNEQVKYLDTTLQSLKNDFSVMYRDVKDDVSRLSAS